MSNLERSSEKTADPLRTLTWWHPLLAALVRHYLGRGFKVEDELSVGKMPLRIDLVILRSKLAQLSPEALRALAGLAELLNVRTIVQFTGPTSNLAPGDFRMTLSYALQYLAQNAPKLPMDQLTIVVIAPGLPKAYRKEAELYGAKFIQKPLGVWEVKGLFHPFWVLDTTVLADTNHPTLAVLSRKMLEADGELIRQLLETEHRNLLAFMTQQIQQFRKLGQEFSMKYTDTDQMANFADEVLRHFTPEDRLRGLSVEQRLSGLPADVIADYLAKLKGRNINATNRPRNGHGSR